MEYRDQILGILIHLLKKNGQLSQQYSSRVILGNNEFIIEISDVQHFDHGTTQVMAISLHVSIVSKYTADIYEIIVGFGSTVAIAIEDGIEQWYDTVLTPLLQSTRIHPGDYLSGTYKVSGSATREIALRPRSSSSGIHCFELACVEVNNGRVFGWDVFASSIYFRGTDADKNVVAEHLAHLPPILFILSELGANISRSQPYWVKLFMCRMQDGQTHGECRLNSQDWKAGLDALERASQMFPWPDSTGYVSLSQFIVLSPQQNA